MLDKTFEAIPEGVEKLKSAVSIRNQMGGVLYWNICNDDCLEMADKLLNMGMDKLAIQRILDGADVKLAN